MPSHYTDDDSPTESNGGNGGSGRSSRSSRSHRSGGGGGGGSYTDRFRVDAPYRAPVLHGSGQSSIGRLHTLIDRAVNPTLREPDLSLNLQIADVINEKKGTAPREAATDIVRHINSRNPHVAILAVAVLDVCVKNCGYPFHLQISRKDFLNNLVKRFPERPPLHYSRVQLLILECIEEWRETIARTSKYRDDLGYIRDMHRLLSHKGYMFPEINRDDAAVLNAPETLKSAAELAKEDEEAQSAKLQELIRSGTPQDLREANHLMSVMAGFRENKVDYHAKVAKDLDKLRRKGEILEEMLNSLQPGEPIADDDVFSELVASLRNAQPKIEKIVHDESADETTDEEAIARVIAVGDYINSLVAKYDLVSKGDHEGAKHLQVPSLASGRKIDTSREAVINSLIDIDDVPTDGEPTGAAADLLGLDFGGLHLGGGDSGEASAPASPAPTGSGSTQGGLVDLLGDFGGSSPGSVAAAATGGRSAAASNAASEADFFDSLTSATLPAPTATIVDDGGKTVEIASTGELKFEFEVKKAANETQLLAKFSNPSDKKITNLKLELAPAKNRTMRIDPPSSTSMEPRATHGITQLASVSGSEPLKVRWRVSFKLGMGDVSLDGVAKDI